MPKIDKLQKASKNFQSIVKCCKSPVNPIKELIEITINEVATASFIGNLAKNTKAGTIKNPPPAPTKPVTIPTTNPCKISNG